VFHELPLIFKPQSYTGAFISWDSKFLATVASFILPELYFVMRHWHLRPPISSTFIIQNFSIYNN